MIEVEDDLDAINALAVERGWSDGLPIVPPTAERVQRVLDHLRRDPDEVVALVPPQAGGATVRHIAVNAVMAGCMPEYVPVVIAAIEAMCEPAFDLHSVQTDVNPVAPVVVVSGPVRAAIGMNWDGNALGQGNRANATIGRAVRLVLTNVGGARPPDFDTAILGQPGKYSFCLAEDEDRSPWEPLSVERGIPAGESAVTVFGATGTQNVLTGVHEPDGMLTLIADSIATLGSNTVLLGAPNSGPMVVLSQNLAWLLHSQGMSKADVKRVLYERARRPAESMPRTKRPERLRQLIIEDGMIHALREPGYIVIVVAGGNSPNHVGLLPAYCNSATVTRRVVLPSA